MEVNIPEPNRGLAQFLLSARLRDICAGRANTAQWLYQSRVAKRTGELSVVAHGHTEIGGIRHDRWIGVLSVHGAIEYEAAHEFGYQSRLGRNVQGPRRFIHGAHDLNAVLEELQTV